jgi:pimeloyl-ACP methyl ester carboxylesterase
VYAPPGAGHNELAVIALHGKRHGKQHPGIVTLAGLLARAGYTVYVPDMPWRNYRADLETAFAFVDELVRAAGTGHHKVVLVGHSMGATVAMLYVARHLVPDKLAGLAVLAPGHLLQRSARIRRLTRRHVQRARKLLQQGNDAPTRFTDINQGQAIPIRTTPAIYLSYFDPRRFPHPIRALRRLPVPLLWLDGREDGLAQRLDYYGIFEGAQYFARNQYQEVTGGHVSMLDHTSRPMIHWLRQFH